ncbi:MAG: RNA recognition motif domain-containing protein [Anaerolineaceae bacterium]
MESKLYVGNLSYDTTEETLRMLFGEAGTVEAVDIIKDRFSGRPKGFAFITMSNQAESEKAIALLNGKEVEGRPLTVNVAKPREERPAYGDRPSYGSNGGRSSYGSNRGGNRGSNNRR